MKVRNLGVLVAIALIMAVAFSVLSLAAPKAGNAVPAPAATAAAASATPADHPEIRDALASLHHAKDHLEHAAHDFGGHRVEAIHAVDEAIRQLEICLKYDR